MREPEFIVADLHVHRAELVEMNIEFLTWVFAEIEKLFGVPADRLVGMPTRTYVSTMIDKVCARPPEGVFYLVKVGDELAGMGGLRSLGGGVAEVKRIYFRAAFRGLRLGDSLLKRLIADATAFGYEKVRLDTALFMTAAHRVYESNGFVDCPAYEGVEVPSGFHARWRFMERAL